MKKIVFLVIAAVAVVACNKEVKKDAITLCEAQKKLLELLEKNAPIDSVKAQEKKVLDIATQINEKYKDVKSKSKEKAFENAYLKCSGTKKLGELDEKIEDAKKKYAQNIVKKEDIESVCKCYEELEKIKDKSSTEYLTKELNCISLESDLSSKYTGLFEAYNYFTEEVKKCKKK
ncbi:MAG: hypothetical protein N2Z72_01420 [Bacteroidales bacterium]|nr:hypothetical protein [Bacteroidales bacterium]